MAMKLRLAVFRHLSGPTHHPRGAASALRQAAADPAEPLAEPVPSLVASPVDSIVACPSLRTSRLPSRRRIAAIRLIRSKLFQRSVVALICLNAVVLGLETSDRLMGELAGVLEPLDVLLLLAFSLELAIRVYAFRTAFFRDPWGVFDLTVVAVAWLPAQAPLAVLRVLQVFRVLRLISVVPSLRTVVEAMLTALPGMGSIVLLMLTLLYVSAVMATLLFGDISPELFGTLGDSFFTLFQLMTLEGWAGEIVKPVMAQQPLAWLFFVPFILIATFIVLNLFIGVIVDSIQTLRETRDRQEADAAETERDRLLLTELRAVRAEVAGLAERLDAVTGATAPRGPQAGQHRR